MDSNKDVAIGLSKLELLQHEKCSCCVRMSARVHNHKDAVDKDE